MNNLEYSLFPQTMVLHWHHNDILFRENEEKEEEKETKESLVLQVLQVISIIFFNPIIYLDNK